MEEYKNIDLIIHEGLRKVQIFPKQISIITLITTLLIFVFFDFNELILITGLLISGFTMWQVKRMQKNLWINWAFSKSVNLNQLKDVAIENEIISESDIKQNELLKKFVATGILTKTSEKKKNKVIRLKNNNLFFYLLLLILLIGRALYWVSRISDNVLIKSLAILAVLLFILKPFSNSSTKQMEISEEGLSFKDPKLHTWETIESFKVSNKLLSIKFKDGSTMEIDISKWDISEEYLELDLLTYQV